MSPPPKSYDIIDLCLLIVSDIVAYGDTVDCGKSGSSFLRLTFWRTYSWPTKENRCQLLGSLPVLLSQSGMV